LQKKAEIAAKVILQLRREEEKDIKTKQEKRQQNG